MIRIDELALDGFRGFAAVEKIDFTQGSVFVFAPNGYGKSSITDAFEFLFSPDGTVKRLGIRDSGTQSGRQPLRNANRGPTEPVSVTLRWRDGGVRNSATRHVLTTRAETVDELERLRAKLPGLFIIRGHDLRKFVESTTPTERYRESAEFLGAARLSRLQDDIQSLKYQITQSDRTSARRTAAKRELQTVLGQALDLGDDVAVKRWIDDNLSANGIQPLASLASSDPSIDKLRDLAAEERSRVRVADLERTVAEIDKILKDDGDGIQAILPVLRLREGATRLIALAEASVEAQRHDVLDAAITYLRRESVDQCPVCETPLSQTKSGSRLTLLDHLEHVQATLADLASADAAVHRLRDASISNREAIAAQFEGLKAALPEPELAALASDWRTAYDAVSAGDDAPLPIIIARLEALRAEVAERLSALRAEGHPTLEPLLSKTQAVLRLREAWRQINVDAAELKVLQREIDAVSAMVNATVFEFLEAHVAALATDTAAIYNSIQEGASVPVSVSLKLVSVESADSRKMEMVLDFPTVGSTKPQGYLSDSQLNTLALAFRVAIVRRFNPDLQFLILDDVFTSHDAEFRDQAAEMIVTQLAETQLLVLTHDDMFARLVQDKSAARGYDSRWRFLRIAAFDVEKGPRFLTRQTPESRLISTWDGGESAGGMLRTWVEEWLESLARQLGAHFTMRRKTRPYDYAHFEMAEAIRDVLKGRYDMDAVMVSVPDFASTINEIVSAVIENEGAHHHGNPYACSDVAQERRYYDRIKRLQAYFRCGQPGCGKKLEYDQSKRRAICSSSDCGHVFELRAQPW